MPHITGQVRDIYIFILLFFDFGAGTRTWVVRKMQLFHFSAFESLVEHLGFKVGVVLQSCRPPYITVSELVFVLRKCDCHYSHFRINNKYGRPPYSSPDQEASKRLHKSLNMAHPGIFSLWIDL